MTWAPEDVTDAMADRCIEQHTEAQLDCAYCATRLDLRVCAQCDEEIWPHETCPNTHDEPALVADGFGRAVVMPPSTGVRAA